MTLVRFLGRGRTTRKRGIGKPCMSPQWWAHEKHRVAQLGHSRGHLGSDSTVVLGSSASQGDVLVEQVDVTKDQSR